MLIVEYLISKGGKGGRRRKRETEKREERREREKEGKTSLTSSWPQNRKNDPLLLLKPEMDEVIHSPFNGTGLVKKNLETLIEKLKPSVRVHQSQTL